ncbi:MAG TPA: hypothetical protein VJZ49_05640 [Syntrophales bacterium]|nr:hypothetical protein [Syntrophales bacterium]
MKICKRCLQEFDENENFCDNPATELADIFLESAGAESAHDLCLQCKQELGMANLMGLGQ